MAKRVECDSCGKTAPDESNRIFTEHPIPHGTTGYGGDGWTILNISLVRTLEPRDYPEHMMVAADSGTHTTLLYTSLDLCPECAERVMLATGCLPKILTKVPRRPRQYMGEPEVEVKTAEVPREPGKTGWERVVEDKDDDDVAR